MKVRRRYFRRRVKVEVDHFNLDDEYQMHFSRDLSRGGVFMEMDEAIPVGTRFLMSFELPGIGTVETEGEVAWVLRLEDSMAGLPPGIGVRFVDLSEEDGAAIDNFLREELEA